MLKTAFLANLFLMFLNIFIVFAIEPEIRQESGLYRSVIGIAPLLLPTVKKEKESYIFEATLEDEVKENDLQMNKIFAKTKNPAGIPKNSGPDLFRINSLAIQQKNDLISDLLFHWRWSKPLPQF